MSNSFDKLKEMLTSAPVLGYPRQDLPYTLDSDASGYGTGAVLSHGKGNILLQQNYVKKWEELLRHA